MGADVAYFCKEAAMKCLRRLLHELNLKDEKLAQEVLDKLLVTMSDFDNAIKDLMPQLCELYLESPDFPRTAIGGLEGKSQVRFAGSSRMAFRLSRLVYNVVALNAEGLVNAWTLWYR